LYGRLFADWLHVHFIIRTVLILLVLWLIIFLAAQLVQYMIAPAVLAAYCRVKNLDDYDTPARSRKFATQLMFICAVAATLWVTAFGLHHEYATPVLLGIEITTPPEPEEILGIYYEDAPLYYAEAEDEAPEIDEDFIPAAWQEEAIFTLNEQGRDGARLRDGPGISERTIIEILWDEAELVFLNAYVPDDYVRGLYWLRVESPSGTVGYISSQLIEG
jgi:hypothetical protein